MKTFPLGHKPLTLLALDAIVYAKVHGNYLGYHTTSHYKSLMGPQLIRHGLQISSMFIMLVNILLTTAWTQKSRMYRQLLSLLVFDKPYFVHEREN